MEIKDKTRLFEMSAVCITGIGKFIFMDFLNQRFIYILFACVFWIGYIVYRTKQKKEILAYWGLSMKNFKSTFLELLPIAIMGAIACILIGNYRETNILDWSFIPVLLLYPIWGIIQQFIIVGLIARNLKDLKAKKIPEIAIILITAIVFAIVHYPHPILIVGTFFLAIVYSFLYLRDRNLLVLGIYHGWLGGLFFYTILARNPWKEVFLKLNN